MKYSQTSINFPVNGELKITERTVKPCRSSKKRLYVDESGQLFAKIFGYWWKFPEQIEY